MSFRKILSALAVTGYLLVNPAQVKAGGVIPPSLDRIESSIDYGSVDRIKADAGITEEDITNETPWEPEFEKLKRRMNAKHQDEKPVKKQSIFEELAQTASANPVAYTPASLTAVAEPTPLTKQNNLESKVGDVVTSPVDNPLTHILGEPPRGAVIIPELTGYSKEERKFREDKVAGDLFYGLMCALPCPDSEVVVGYCIKDDKLSCVRVERKRSSYFYDFVAGTDGSRKGVIFGEEIKNPLDVLEEITHTLNNDLSRFDAELLTNKEGICYGVMLVPHENTIPDENYRFNGGHGDGKGSSGQGGRDARGNSGVGSGGGGGGRGGR